MSESTFHTTREDLRKAESQVSKKNDGNVPADSEVAQTKVPSLPFPSPLLSSPLLPLPPALTPTKHTKTTPPQSLIDQNSKPKSEIIAERQSNLPLPDAPPVASDWNSSDARKVDVGSGGVEGDVSYGGDIREPATSESSARTDGGAFGKNSEQPQGVGREGHDGLDGLPKDALKK